MNNNCAQKGIVNVGICTRKVLAGTRKKSWLFKCNTADVSEIMDTGTARNLKKLDFFWL